MWNLKELSEFFNRYAGCLNDCTHGQRFDGIVPRDNYYSHAVGHDDVLTLALNDKTNLLQSFDSIKMIDSR